MSDSEEAFQIVKHKRFRRKHSGQAWLDSAHQKLCHSESDNDAIESQRVLEKLHSCR